MRSHAMRGRRLARGRRPRPSPLSIHYLSRGHLARQPCHQLRSFCLLYAAFRLNALLWNGGRHECRILVPNLDRYHCLWHLDRRWHDRRWLAFGLGAHGTAYRHCGFDQPLSSNSRSQNRVAEPGARASPRLEQRDGNGLSTVLALKHSGPPWRGLPRLKGSTSFRRSRRLKPERVPMRSTAGRSWLQH
jgi:hypothetical protein